MMSIDPASPAALAKNVVGFWNHMRVVSATEFVERVDELGLVIKQVELMRALQSDGAMTVEALAARVLIAPNEAVEATEPLVTRGLLERGGADESLAIAEAGREVVAELGDIRQRTAERYFAEMTDLQRSRLAAALEVLPSA